MIDWTKSMQQSFEYYTVNPKTWKDKEKLNTITTASINYDLGSDTVSDMSLSAIDLLGEDYIRAYLIAVQNGERYKIPLGTNLIQTPSDTFDGKKRSVDAEAYSPLLELKENKPPLGYSIAKKSNILKMAYSLVNENTRAPVVMARDIKELEFDFVSQPADNWISFVNDLLRIAKYRFYLDEMGRIMFAPIQDIRSLQPVTTFDETNSILYPDISMDHDLYGIPNRVEVIYSNGRFSKTSVVVNDNPNSPVSVQTRGRYITERIENPSLPGVPTEIQLDEYAKQILQQRSSVNYTVSYSHGYYPVHIGDCVRINYPAAGINNVKAMIISQNIKCEPGCPVEEKAIITNNLWR